MESAYDDATERLRIAMGKQKPLVVLGPAKPDWLKPGGSGKPPSDIAEPVEPAEKQEENSKEKAVGNDTVAQESSKADNIEVEVADSEPKQEKKWITLSDDSGEEEESSDSVSEEENS